MYIGIVIIKNNNQFCAYLINFQASEMIKLAQSTVNEDERKRILYQSLKVIIDLAKGFYCHEMFFYFLFGWLNLGIERSGSKV